MTTADVAALHAELHARPYPFMRPEIECLPRGARSLAVVDPSGNGVIVYQADEA